MQRKPACRMKKQKKNAIKNIALHIFYCTLCKKKFPALYFNQNPRHNSDLKINLHHKKNNTKRTVMQIKNLFRYWTYQVFSPGTVLREKYEAFKILLDHDKIAHEHMAALEELFYTPKKVDYQTIVKTYEQFATAVYGMVDQLLKMCPSNYWSLKEYFKKFDFYIRFMLAPPEFDFSPPFVIDFEKIPQFDNLFSGNKAFNLATLNQELHLPSPNGFVITTNAFHYFMETNDLREAINEKLACLDISDTIACEKTSLEIQQFILDADVPEELVKVIDQTVAPFRNDSGTTTRFALRSSAVKEDGSASFAGQYKTLLNIRSGNLIQGYKEVVAGKYSSQALFYRISHGILDHEAPMAVLVLEMIDSKSSGVIYTKDIENQTSDDLLIHAAWGQGEFLVEGTAASDIIAVSKTSPQKITRMTIADKKKQMCLIFEESSVNNQAGVNHTKVISTPKEKINVLCLDKSSALTLARWAVSLENHFGQPQDIEWCQDQSGRLFILQSRPLNLKSHVPMDNTDTAPEALDNTIENQCLCSDAHTVSSGAGSGPVYPLEQLSQIPDIPKGAVLVVKHALPEFVNALNSVNAVVIEQGSHASHFASIAREFEIPAVVNIEKQAFQNILNTGEITVDADRGAVYEGVAEPPLALKKPKANLFDKSSFMVKLKYVISFAAQLKLTDPKAKSFSPEACRSLHDIIRFTHETAVREMFLIGNRKGGRKKGAKKLVFSVPMLFYILDVGNGLKKGSKNKKILPLEDIDSTPMNAILKGLSHPDICWSETTHFDWEEYDRIVMSGGIISADAAMFGSYAVLSREYINVNFRFGYHFVILDAICADVKEDNYILFRFSGGGGDIEARSIRARFIQGILERLGFLVQVTSDLIDAQFKKGTPATMETTLDMIGRLLGATKLMDMYLKEDSDIPFLVDQFMAGRYDFRTTVENEPTTEIEEA